MFVADCYEGEAVDYGTVRDVGWRIRREREARGLSYRSLAEAMGKHGCAIQPSALQRMETGYPGQPEKRPKIGVEELVALCEVFNLTPADMLRPRQAVEDEETTRLAAEYRDRAESLADSVLGIASFYRRVGRVADSRGREGVAELRSKMRLHVAGLSKAMEPYGFGLTELVSEVVTAASMLGSELGYQKRRDRGAPAAPELEQSDLEDAGLTYQRPHDWGPVLAEAAEALDEWESDQEGQGA